MLSILLTPALLCAAIPSRAETPSGKAAAKKAPVHGTAGHAGRQQGGKNASTKTSAKKGRPAPGRTGEAKTPPGSSPRAASTRTASHKSAAKGATVRRVAQQQPTPERYKEIQEALARKGYFQGTPDGNWGPDSQDALKRFQKDQNLEPDGKIGSLSLIALGLGPKRDNDTERASKAAEDPADPPPVAQPEP
jgi:hypothetical protein